MLLNMIFFLTYITLILCFGFCAMPPSITNDNITTKLLLFIILWLYLLIIYIYLPHTCIQNMTYIQIIVLCCFWWWNSNNDKEHNIFIYSQKKCQITYKLYVPKLPSKTTLNVLFVLRVLSQSIYEIKSLKNSYYALNTINHYYVKKKIYNKLWSNLKMLSIKMNSK